ncbi:hypothetical protein JMUB6875_30380 [Nocardia sp. JMUB6875]
MVGGEGEGRATAHGEAEDAVAIGVEAQAISQGPAKIVGEEGFPGVAVALAGAAGEGVGRAGAGVRGAGAGRNAEEGAGGVPVGVETGLTTYRHDHIDVGRRHSFRDIGLDFPAVEVLPGPHAIEGIDDPVGIAVSGAQHASFDGPHGGIDPEIEGGRIEGRRRRCATAGYGDNQRCDQCHDQGQHASDRSHHQVLSLERAKKRRDDGGSSRRHARSKYLSSASAVSLLKISDNLSK